MNKTISSLSEIIAGSHDGPGGVIILTAIEGCGCYYRCLALNARKTQAACICPKNWRLGDDGKSCIRKHFVFIKNFVFILNFQLLMEAKHILHGSLVC